MVHCIGVLDGYSFFNLLLYQPLSCRVYIYVQLYTHIYIFYYITPCKHFYFGYHFRYLDRVRVVNEFCRFVGFYFNIHDELL